MTTPSSLTVLASMALRKTLGAPEKLMLSLSILVMGFNHEVLQNE